MAIVGLCRKGFRKKKKQRKQLSCGWEPHDDPEDLRSMSAWGQKLLFSLHLTLVALPSGCFSVASLVGQLVLSWVMGLWSWTCCSSELIDSASHVPGFVLYYQLFRSTVNNQGLQDASVGAEPPVLLDFSAFLPSHLQIIVFSPELPLPCFVGLMALVNNWRNKWVPQEEIPAHPFQTLTDKPMSCEASDCHRCNTGLFLFNKSLPIRVIFLPVLYNHCTL